MTQDSGEVVVRDLGSTNGIRINGMRVEIGRLKPGDELSIAHIRYRLETGQGHEMTIADGNGPALPPHGGNGIINGGGLVRAGQAVDDARLVGALALPMAGAENHLAAAVREFLPPGIAEKCRIQVIVQMEKDQVEVPEPCRPDSSPLA